MAVTAGYWPNKVIVKLKPGAISKPTGANPVGVLPSFLSLLAKLRRENGLKYVQCLDRRGGLFWSNLTVALVNLLANANIKAAMKELRAPLKDGLALSFPVDPQAKKTPLKIPPPPSAKELVAMLSRYVLTFEDGKMPDNVAAILAAHSGVEYAELVPLLSFPGPGQTPGGAPSLEGTRKPAVEKPLRELSKPGKEPQPAAQANPPQYEAQWGERCLGWTPNLGAHVDLGTIAMLDTGLDFDHPQLDGFIASGDPNYGWDWQGHGTHVAGIIMARWTKLDGPGGEDYSFGGLLREATKGKLVCYKVVSNDLFYPSKGDAFYPVDPVYYTSALLSIAANPKFKFVNISMCRDVPMTQSEAQDVKLVLNSKKRIVAAAGNRFDTSVPPEITYPSAHQGVIAVGALSIESSIDDGNSLVHNPKRWTSSRFKSLLTGKGVDIWAPGFNILSTMPVEENPDFTYLKEWSWMGGTSMAAPMITALLAAKPQLAASPQALKNSSWIYDVGGDQGTKSIRIKP